ncbi:Putative adenylyl cyclase [Desulfonema limicola]|uniref:Adenylyl cyclase n=1 Tax=Desulfonema limicola TaxID=45656 RepID=A0A975BC34_9BACT|nr:class IV adenylate cyclase [Desulfonema limicola]QTA82611.1 Putative adenylyl cyclase [Desulfonema limicola]
MAPLEIEVKYYLEDIEPVRRFFLNSGAVHLNKHFEQNICFEDSENSLIKKQSLLRLRKDTKNWLTFKSRPGTDTQFKIMKELETQVSSFSVMEQILESIGFHKQQIYEKYRETFIMEDTHICIDTMPFGNFLEIEGSKDQIIKLADMLGLKWEKRIIKNYLEIFNYLKKELCLPFNDLSFENFKTLEIDMDIFMSSFEAGK